MKCVVKVERLNSIRNEMTHLWGSVFILGGGSVAFIVLNPSPVKYFLGIIGIAVAMMLLNAYFIRRVELLNILKALEEEK